MMLLRCCDLDSAIQMMLHKWWHSNEATWTRLPRWGIFDASLHCASSFLLSLGELRIQQQIERLDTSFFLQIRYWPDCKINGLTSHFSLLTSHFSLLTSHFSLLTSHFSLDSSLLTSHLTRHFSLLTSHLTSHFSLVTCHLTRHFSLLTSHSSLVT